ncbi:DUF2795 domain-containing protein [Catellatospora bangladeshensis]|uniref:DUF2795 domain-containing protein n=1 Tax=Catellatospora bangladeshensis TaxID=310355 RepID=A0A8J3JGV8_9ACTN|nr:DUF2795 domain-containing protein [Catellatospora bangladeshensis]GIF84647.1 hypothetical protein Cba03nite_59960 [Catellatospora bangladeshensis]
MTVTRIELANHIEAAFTTGPATRDELLAFAACSHARPDVIAVIRTLPERPYPAMRDLWTDLAHIPIGE